MRHFLLCLLLSLPLAAVGAGGDDSASVSDTATAAGNDGKKPRDKRSESRRKVDEATATWLKEIEEERVEREGRDR